MNNLLRYCIIAVLFIVATNAFITSVNANKIRCLKESNFVRPLADEKIFQDRPQHQGYSFQLYSKPKEKDSLEDQAIFPTSPTQTRSFHDDQDITIDIVKTVSWTFLASIVAGVFAMTKGTAAAIEFSSGYLLELCLSVDNLFVFLLLFDFFKVGNRHDQNKILNYGIIGALLLRGLFIVAGVAALERFHQVLLIFAAVLGYSSFKIIFGKEEDEEEDMENNKLVQFSRKLIKSTSEFHGDKFFIRDEQNRRVATPLFLCLLCVELSDIIFAFDSVPAVFGVTSDPWIIYSSNILAIAGLRSLFNVLQRAVSQLAYLEKSVGVILAVIAAKIFAEAFHIQLLDPLQSLLVVFSILSIGVATSLLQPKSN